MAEDQGRAERIAQLKQQHPRLTWAKIAEHVGVTERSAIKWQRTGALETENAVKLAELFGVDFDYVWWGPRPDTPELFVDRRRQQIADEDRLGRVEEEVRRGREELQEVRRSLEELHGQREGFLELLAAQQQVLEGIADHLGDDALRNRAEKAVAASIQQARAGLAAASEAHASQAAAPDPAAAGGTRGTRRKSKA
jgi:DNA-binding XRE family transcriptional regulator